MSYRRARFILACLTLLAAVLRLWRLSEVPPGLFLDEAGNGLDALDILAGRPSLFFERSLGKEPLLNYLIVPFVAWLGREPLAVRLPAALVGTLTVPATFFLARELWHEEGRDRATWIGWIAAGLLAVSYWAVTLNRISFRANTLPFLAAVAFTLVWRTWRRGGKGRAVAAGVTLGLCFYTYLAGRFVYPLALVGLGLAAMTPDGRSLLRRRRQELLLMAGVCLAVMLPLLVHFARHPEDFIRRADQVVFTRAAAEAGTPLIPLWESLIGNLGMFGGTGDLEPRHNLPGRSLLTPWLAVLFWTGMGLALLRGRRHPAQGFAVAWFVLLLLPAILAAIPPRHALRAIGTQPIVYSLCALACVETVSRLTRRRRPDRLPPALMGLLLGGLVTVEASLTVSTYFGRWANDPATYFAYLGQDRAVATAINQAPPAVRYVVPLNDRWRGLGGKYTFDFLVSDRSRVLFFFPQADNAIARLNDLVNTPGVEQVRVVWMAEGDDVSADPQRVTALLLGRMAQPLAGETGAGYTVETFIPAASGPVRLDLPMPSRPVRASFADAAGRSLLLIGWNVADSAAADAHVTAGGLGTVALQWSATAPPSVFLRVSLRLVDAYRQLVGQADSDLVDTTPLYNPDWPPGHTATTYHPLEAAPGTPPGLYTLLLAVYEADTLRRWAVTDADGIPREVVPLGQVQVAAPWPTAPAYAPPVALPQPLVVADGLTLLGHDGLPTQGVPGLPLPLALGWEVTKPQTGRTVGVWLGDHPLGRLNPATLPLGRWRLAQPLPVPPDLAPGVYPLLLRDEAVSATAIPLGHVTVEPQPQPTHRLSARFVGGVTLEGWRLDRTESGLLLTLFWQTERPLDQDWSVFVHLVGADGALIAQHDAAPDNGRYPTTLWPTGVLIPDRHLLGVSDMDSEMTLRVGLYLPSSGRRLPLSTGGDFVAWPPVEP
ncbi:MAG: glycosyltransferase family 39 protein [Caldilineales bacterium]|nr:glycosyltransferase family 39 protein [Caldilineales bacterium]